MARTRAGGRLFAAGSVNHVHFRNVLVDRPYQKYQEVFIDAGVVDMFGVIGRCEERVYGDDLSKHPRALDYDRERAGGRIGGYPGGGGYTGFAFSVAIRGGCCRRRWRVRGRGGGG